MVLRVRLEDGELRLTVRDDGGGLGLASMRQRTEEIGGRFGLAAAGPGTLVSAVLPVGAA